MIAWSQKYATGIERIDEQHRMIFKMAADFEGALDEGGGERAYGALLGYLGAYCRGHFRFEESCMEDYKCPVAQENKDAHVHFMEVLDDYSRRYETGGYQAEDAKELVDLIDSWLDAHICRIDIHIKNCVRD